MTVFTEGGLDDASEQVDSYVIPTWAPESVQDVLARYFPHATDADGLVNSISTPNFATFPPTWHEHFLSDIAWWNVYQTCGDATDCANVGNTPLRDQVARRGSSIFIRFNRDSDRDGYPDRIELKYGTDPHDPASHPQPELVAGYTSSRSGNVVTVKLALENSGTFDAYHVSAVMYSPDGTTTIGNNTVGGNGRVRPGHHVAVGSLVKPPSLALWGGSTARPYSGGDYGGNVDRLYTFSASTPGTVGSSTTAMTWNDGMGGNGTLDLGASYHAPLPRDVSQGLQVGFNSGTIAAGASFTVTALTPRDTFTYTVNTGPDPYTKPVVVVSYSDPQGAHRFVTPIEVPSVGVGLVPTHTGQMLPGVGLQIATTGAVITSGANTTNFVFNSPDAASVQGAHLYVDFVSNGALVSHLPYTLTLPAGPSVYAVSWATSQFSQTYNANDDNILIAHWTDSEGNIIDSAARPLNTFASDPVPAFAMANGDTTWNFGTVTQGEQLQHTFTFASTGSLQLLSYLGNTAGLSVAGATTRQLSPADTATYTVTLDTTNQPTGAFNRTLTLRTSDAANPTRTLTITGTINAPSGAANAFDIVNRPWDKRVLVYGNVAQYTPVDFTENIQPDISSIEPCKVLDASGTTLKGVGKYCADFGGVTTSSQMFGDGRDGDRTITNTTDLNPVRATTSGLAGSNSLTITGVTGSGFQANQLVMIHQSRGAGVGVWEFKTLQAVNGSQLILTASLSNTYITDSGANRAQVLWVPQYHNFTVSNGLTITVAAWDGSTGGIAGFLANGTVAISGTLSAAGGSGQGGASTFLAGSMGGGFRGGDSGNGGAPKTVYSGEGTAGPSVQQTAANGNGGGGAWIGNPGYAGGGGGGNGTAGFTGGGLNPGSNGTSTPGAGGGIAGNSTLTNMVFGGGGGGGTRELLDSDVCAGSAGGGIILINANAIAVSGRITGDGGNSGSCSIGGGSGAGGSILIKTVTASLGSSLVTAIGGGGSGRDVAGGAGGAGRIRIEYCNSLTGTTNPSASTQKLTCYIAEKTTASNVHFTVPDIITGGQNYVMQFGRHYAFGVGGGTVMTPTRLTSQNYANATMDALVTNVGAGGTTNLTVTIGTQPFAFTQNITQPTIIPLTNFASAINNYIASQPPNSTIDVPMRVTIDRQADVLLTNLALTPGANVDVSIGANDISFGGAATTDGATDKLIAVAPSVNPLSYPLSPLSPSSPTEGATVPVTATLHNNGSADSGGLTAAFYATLPGIGPWYVGSAYVPNIVAGGTATASILWNTLGFTGTTPLRVVADPFNRIAETNENNNQVTATLTILSRPDLQVTRIVPSDREPNANESVSIGVVVRNFGQTGTSNFDIALYDGNPSTSSGPSGGVLVGTRTLSVAPGVEVTSTLQWTPTRTGQHQLFAVADTGNTVSEYDEGNNQTVLPVYVGFIGPILIDSGGTNDLAYTPTLGYGYLNTDSSATNLCGNEPYQTMRVGVTQTLSYRFDHLLPGHFYHLDLTLFDCTGLGRNESVQVDGITFAGPFSLLDAQPHSLSLRLDPALYQNDNTIIVTIFDPSLPAVVSAIALYDIDYRYADAGANGELAWSPSHNFGYLDGIPQNNWGNLPLQTYRQDIGDNQLRYRFDGLNSAKRYTLNMMFYHRNPTVNPVQQIGIDDAYTGLPFTVPYSQPYGITLTVPLAAYAGDGSIVVFITRTNAVVGAFVNEIALEEQTLAVTPTLSADLALALSASAPTVTLGSNLTYNLVVSNNGPDPAPNVAVSDNLPDGVTFVSATPTQGNCNRPSAVVCSLGALINGGSASVSIVVTPIVTGTLTNSASVSSDVTDFSQSNNSATAVTTVTQQPTFRVYMPILER